VFAAAVVVVVAVFAAGFSPIGDRIGTFVESTVLGREPLVISATSDTDRFNFAGAPISMKFTFPLSSMQLPPPPPSSERCTNRYTWAHSLGGEDHFSTYGQVSLYARSAGVAVLGARVEIVERLAPMARTVVGCDLGGPIDVSYLSIDLDRAVAEYSTGSGVDDVRPFALEVAQGETEVVQFWAFSGTCDCRWRIILDVQVDGVVEEIAIDNDGVPFVTYASGEVRDYYQWYADQQQWILLE